MYFNQYQNEWMYEQPIGVHHYLGSYERFMYKGDERRNDVRYYEFANGSRYAKGDLNDKIEYYGKNKKDKKRINKEKEEEFQSVSMVDWWMVR